MKATISNDTIIAAQQGDMDAFLEQALTSVQYMAYSFSQSSGISAEDLLQEVGLRLFLKSDKVLAARSVSAYVRMLARNTMINHYRKVARRRRIVRTVQLGGHLDGVGNCF